MPCPPLLDTGYGRYADGVTHLLLGWVHGRPLAHREMPAATDETQFRHWLGVELIIEVGYRLRTPDAVVSIGARTSTFDGDTRRLAELATAMLTP